MTISLWSCFLQYKQKPTFPFLKGYIMTHIAIISECMIELSRAPHLATCIKAIRWGGEPVKRKQSPNRSAAASNPWLAITPESTIQTKLCYGAGSGTLSAKRCLTDGRMKGYQPSSYWWRRAAFTRALSHFNSTMLVSAPSYTGVTIRLLATWYSTQISIR